MSRHSMHLCLEKAKVEIAVLRNFGLTESEIKLMTKEMTSSRKAYSNSFSVSIPPKNTMRADGGVLTFIGNTVSSALAYIHP